MQTYFIEELENINVFSLCQSYIFQCLSGYISCFLNQKKKLKIKIYFSLFSPGKIKKVVFGLICSHQSQWVWELPITWQIGWLESNPEPQPVPLHCTRMERLLSSHQQSAGSRWYHTVFCKRKKKITLYKVIFALELLLACKIFLHLLHF